MKKLLILIALLPCAFILKAQTNVYHPFPDSNATWIISCGSFGELVHIKTYHIQGDTVIDSAKYSKLYSGSYYHGGLREDTMKRVYFYPTEYPHERLLYDFSAQPGDTIYNVYSNLVAIIDSFDLIVNRVDSILIGNSYRKQIRIWNQSPWIEGVGSYEGLIEANYHGLDSYSCVINCLIQDDSLLYNNSNSHSGIDCTLGIKNEEKQNITFEIYPSPFQNKITVINNGNTVNILTINFFNILGQHIYLKNDRTSNMSYTIDTSTLQKGVYFIQIKTNEQLFTKKIVKI